jgi:transcriptional regulator with XRE-family HTH domain
MTPKDKIASLIESGWTLAEIARAIGSSRMTVTRYANGERQPTYDYGSKIMKLRPKKVAA